MKLLGSNVLVKRKSSGALHGDLMILLPEEVMVRDSFECTVLAVGPGEVLGNGERERMDVVPGDTVVIFQGMGETVDDGFIIDISALEAVVE